MLFHHFQLMPLRDFLPGLERMASGDWRGELALLVEVCSGKQEVLRIGRGQGIGREGAGDVGDDGQDLGS